MSPLRRPMPATHVASPQVPETRPYTCLTRPLHVACSSLTGRFLVPCMSLACPPTPGIVALGACTRELLLAGVEGLLATCALRGGSVPMTRPCGRRGRKLLSWLVRPLRSGPRPTPCGAVPALCPLLPVLPMVLVYGYPQASGLAIDGRRRGRAPMRGTNCCTHAWRAYQAQQEWCGWRVRDERARVGGGGSGSASRGA